MTQQIKTVNIRGKSYVEVAERVRLVHEQKHKFEVISSEPYTVADRCLWRVQITVDDLSYQGNAEVKLNAPKNTPDGTNPFECAETSAIGRALAFAGFGSVESIASFDEVYRAMTNQGEPRNGHAPTPSAPADRQSKALLDMISKAKSRVAALDMIWDSVKGDALQKNVLDKDLTVQQVAQINGVITKYEAGTKPVAVAS